MFKSINRLLIGATVILAVSMPSVAYARFVEIGPSTGSAASGQAQPSIAQPPTAAKRRQLDQLQARVAQRFASEGSWPAGVSTGVSAHSTIPSSQGGFPWGDVGIGAAGLLALVGIGAGATLVIRRRVQRPLAS
jgi:hypothetical protein